MMQVLNGSKEFNGDGDILRSMYGMPHLSHTPSL